MTSDKRPELTSWKEIADRLQVTVRTAQDWEKKRGLPVRRVPRGRGRVFMLVDELEAWLLGRDAETAQGSAPAPLQDPSPRNASAAGPGRAGARSVSGPGAPPPSVPLRALAASALVALVALSAGLFSFVYAPAEVHGPSQWAVTDHEFVVGNVDGLELWRATFEEKLDRRRYESGSPARQPRFVDLDRDGSTEVLFVKMPASNESPPSMLCFDVAGQLLWSFESRATISTGTETFPDYYVIANYVVVDLDGGRRAILTVSTHYMQYPTRLALLSADDGRLLAEYWHAGHIGNDPGQLAVRDHDGDGRVEVLAAGVSNEHRRATLVVLDIETMRGASTADTPEYQFEGFDPGNEIARILFPRSAMNLATDQPHNVGAHVFLTPELIGVGVLEQVDGLRPSVIYQLRPENDFALDHIVPSSTFQGIHERMFREGRLSRSFDDEMEALRAVQYLGTPGSLLIPAR